jgi:nicotinamidase-related amidase
MNEQTAVRSRRLADRSRSALWAVDLQPRLITTLPAAAEVVTRSREAINAARLLNVPTAATTQYEVGLGPLDEGIRAAIGDQPCWDKRAFSAVAAETVAWLVDRQIEQVVLCGVETHICVLQTALDLLAHGYEVIVLADGVAAGSVLDHQIGLRRMSDEGAIIATLESVVMEWLGTSADEAFKSISQLLKGLRARPG